MSPRRRPDGFDFGRTRDRRTGLPYTRVDTAGELQKAARLESRVITAVITLGVVVGAVLSTSTVLQGLALALLSVAFIVGALRPLIRWALFGAKATAYVTKCDRLQEWQIAAEHQQLFDDDRRRGRAFTDVPKGAQWPDVTVPPTASDNQGTWYAYARALDPADLAAALSRAPALRADRLAAERAAAIAAYEAHIAAHDTTGDPVEWLRREAQLRAELPHGYKTGGAQ